MIADIYAFLNAQPMFTGLVGATLMGAVLFLLRQLPHALFERLKSLFTVTLVIEQRDEGFKAVTEWLAAHSATRKARRLMMAEIYDYDAGRWNWTFSLGQGWHLLRHGKAWLLINREIKEGGELAQMLGGANAQKLWITSIGRSQAPLRDLIKLSQNRLYGSGLVNVHVFDGGWMCVDRRRPRPMETVFMPAEQKARILGDMRRFLNARELYAQRGVPWRRGYLLKGQPGTGKTTLIFACAGELLRPVYLLNLNNVRGDNELIAAFNQVDRDGIIVIEDIDTFKITADRETAPAEVPVVQLAGPAAQKVTLSGLLNAIDGMAARDGRLLFITSNYAEVLDPALLRPGRIDMVEEIGALGREDAVRMIEAFGADPAMADRISYPIVAAELQGMLLRADEGPVLRAVA